MTDGSLADVARVASITLGVLVVASVVRLVVLERRRTQRVALVALAVLTLEVLADHVQRLGSPITYRVPLNLVAFTLTLLAIARSRWGRPPSLDRRRLAECGENKTTTVSDCYPLALYTAAVATATLAVTLGKALVS